LQVFKNKNYILLALASSLLAIVGFVHFQSDTSDAIPVHSPEKSKKVVTALASDDNDRHRSLANNESPHPAPTSFAQADNEQSCGNRREWVIAERERLEDFTVEPWQFRAYSNLSEAQTLALVDQGDTKAMVIMGMRSRLIALGRKPQSAVPYLIAPYKLPTKINPSKDAERESRNHAGDAAEYFYQAAIHGRLLALRTYGEQLELAGLDAVSLGWVSDDEYAEFSDVEKAKLRPSEVFESLAYELVPNLVNEWTHSVKIVYPFDEDYAELRNRILAVLDNRFREELNRYGDVLPIVRKSSISKLMVLECLN
jgi:hypothetical protein